MVLRLDGRASDFPARFARLVERRRTPGADVRREVEAILARVAAEGDAALLDYTARFDRQRLRPEQLRIGEDEIAGAVAGCPAELRAALELAAARIDAFHRRQLPQALDYADELGVRLGLRWRPIAAVGIYVPGGTAAYPSSVLMNALPARIAGVPRLVDGRAGARRRAQPAGARRGAPRRRRRDLPGRRRPGDRRARVRHREHPRASTRSWVRATPMSPKPSARCSAASAST